MRSARFAWPARNLWVLALAGVLVFPAALRAGAGIDVLSEGYQLRAQWVPNFFWTPPIGGPQQAYPLGDWSRGYQVLPSGQITGGYDLTSSDGSPLSASTTAPGPSASFSGLLGANATIGDFTFLNSSYSSSWHGGTAPLGGILSFSGTIQTSGQAFWDFRPTAGQLNLNVAGSFINEYGDQYSGLTIVLQDRTSATTLLDIVNPHFPNPICAPGGEDFSFAVDPNHVYEFGIFGWSNTYDSDSAYESITASISAVPEPSTISFAALFAIGFGLKHRTRIKP